MNGFGALKYIFWERWKNHGKTSMFNGVIVVRMALTKHIPSYVTIGGHRSLCTYEGQPPTCRQCDQPSHAAGKCPTRKSTNPSPPSSASTKPQQQQKSPTDKTNDPPAVVACFNSKIEFPNLPKPVPHTNSASGCAPQMEKEQRIPDNNPLALSLVSSNKSQRASSPPANNPKLNQVKRQHSIQQQEDETKRTRTRHKRGSIRSSFNCSPNQSDVDIDSDSGRNGTESRC